MQPFRSFIPPLAAMLMTATGGASAHGVLIDGSEIRFVGKQPGRAVEGKFRKWRANVDFRPRELAKSRADFEIELGSVDLANEQTEAEVRRPVWLDTGKFPVARFTSRAMKDLGGNRYEVAGALTIKGVTRDIVIPMVLRRDAAGNSVAEGQFALNRLDFRIGDGLFADTRAMAYEVGVRIRMVLPPVA